MSERIAIAEIAITRAEGLIELCGQTETATSFEEANAILRKWAPSVYGNGSEKCDFRITFADGFPWTGTYGLSREGCPDLAEHVRGTFEMFVSDDPDRANFRRWVDPDGLKAAAIREMLERYDLPAVSEAPAGPAPR